MAEYYAEAASASTIDYIGYCWKRLYPHGGTTLHYREQPINGVFHCGFASTRNGRSFIVKFYVPMDEGGVVIRRICNEAADALDSMILRVSTK